MLQHITSSTGTNHLPEERPTMPFCFRERLLAVEDMKEGNGLWHVDSGLNFPGALNGQLLNFNCPLLPIGGAERTPVGQMFRATVERKPSNYTEGAQSSTPTCRLKCYRYFRSTRECKRGKEITPDDPEENNTRQQDLTFPNASPVSPIVPVKSWKNREYLSFVSRLFA